MTFYASIADDATKTTAEVDGERTKVLWAEGDAYAMSVKGGAFAKFTLEGEGGQTTGTFTGTATAGDGTQNVAYYPYAEGVTMVDGKLNVVIPAVQAYSANSIAAAPMVAVSTDNTLKFQNVASLIKITLKGTETITSISLKGNSGEALAGKAEVSLSEVPELTLAADAAEKAITLDCGEGIELSEEGVDFYFAVPAITLENGFTLVITDIDNKVMTKTTTNEVKLTASKVKVFPAFDYEASLTASPNYAISSAKGLRWIAEQVNSGANSFAGATITLANDIDLNDEEWIPIGSANQEHGFMGNFDGNNKTIKNLKMTELTLDADNYVYAGLFGVTEGTDPDNQNYIKDLVIENVTIKTTGHIAAAAIAYPYYTVVENITVKGNISIEGGDYTAGVLAYTRRCIDAENISIKGNGGSSINGARVVGGVISDIQMNGGLIANYSNFSASGLTITGENMVGGISGLISGQTLDGAIVKNITLSGNKLGVVSGSMGDSSVIKNIITENVSGATATVGYAYSSVNPIEAKIGDKYYSTLLQALSNVKEGETITLQSDIELTDGITIPSGATMILDLNGKTISQKLVCTESYNMITNNGSLTIQGGGKLSLEDLSEGGSSTWGSYTICNYGTLVIENGVIEHLGTSDDDHDTSIPIQNYQGKVVVNGGTISSPEFRSLRDFTAGGTIEINGGVFNGQVWMQGLGTGSSSLTINGGEFSPCYGYDGSSIYITNNTNIINVEIKGGTFNTKIGCVDANKEGVKGSISGGNFTQTAKDNTNAALIAEGCIFDQLNDGTFDVVRSYSLNESGNYVVYTKEGLKSALEAAGKAGAGNTEIVLPVNGEFDMSSMEWTPINVDGYNGADIVTVKGNGTVITGLKAPLFAGGFAGGSGIEIYDLTIANSEISSTDGTGSGAFIEASDSQTKIYLKNCHLKNSSVTGSRTGGLVGWTSGYSNVNDGPVKSYITFENCSVIECTITGSSVGGINGHAGASDWTYTTITDCTVKDCILNSTDEGGWRVGVAVGTANLGEVTITNLTESGNVLTQVGKEAPTGEKRNYYGRFVPGTTGKLTIDGVAVTND